MNTIHLMINLIDRLTKSINYLKTKRLLYIILFLLTYIFFFILNNDILIIKSIVLISLNCFFIFKITKINKELIRYRMEMKRLFVILDEYIRYSKLNNTETYICETIYREIDFNI